MNCLLIISSLFDLFNLTLDLGLTRDYYPVFYKTAFLIGVFVLFFEGIRSKIKSSTWLICIVFTFACVIIGSRLGTFNLSQWEQFLHQDVKPNFGHKSAFGGMLFGILGFLFIKRFFGLKNHVVDSFAFFIPLVMLFQRIGCLMAGCCFGKPYEGLGCVHYSGFSFIRDYQLSMGWINYNEMMLLPVHAVPVYLMVVSLLTIVILVWAKPRLKNPGSLILLSLTCMGLGRFGVEFFRESITNHALGSQIYGLKAVQWVLIIATSIGAIWLFWNEMRKTNAQLYHVEIKPQREISAVVFLSIFIIQANTFFTLEELMVLHAVLGIAIFGILRQLLLVAYQSQMRLELKLVPYLLCGIAFIFMGQTYHYRNWDFDSSKTQTIVTQNLIYKNLIQTQYPCIESGQGCLGPVCTFADTSNPMGPHYYNTTLTIDQYRKTKKKFDLNYGIQGQLENYYNHQPNSNYRFNVYPYFGLDGNKNFGFRLGLRMGNMFNGTPLNNSITNYTMAGRFWLGYKENITLQVAVFDSDIGGNYAAPFEAKLNFNISKFTDYKMGQMSLGLALRDGDK